MGAAAEPGRTIAATLDQVLADGLTAPLAAELNAATHVREYVDQCNPIEAFIDREVPDNR
jgi:hypothetical protein